MSSIKSDQKDLSGFQEIERTTLEERVAQLQNALARTTDGVTSPRNIRVRVPDDVASIVTSVVGSSSSISDDRVVAVEEEEQTEEEQTEEEQNEEKQNEEK